MNTKRYETIIDLINIMNGALVTYAIIMALLYAIGGPNYAIPKVLLFSLLLIIPFISYYLERKAKHIITFLLCHIILGIIFFLLAQQLYVKIINVIYTVIVMLYHFSRRLKSETIIQGNSSYVWPFILIGLQLYAQWKEYSQLSYIIPIITLLCTILFFANMYLLNFTDFFTNETVDVDVNFPRIKRINHSFILGFLCITIFIMIGTYIIPSHYLLSTIMSVVLYILRLFFSLFRRSNTVDESEVIVDNSPVADLSSLGVASEPNPVWLIIQDILLNIFYVAIIIGFISLLVYGIYQLYKHFHKVKEDGTDKKEFVSPFFKESNVEMNRTKQKNQLHFFLSNNEKIRRYFYREVKKKYKDNVPYNLTADELINLSVKSFGLLISKEAEKFDPLLLNLYHKARYSNELCTKDEVNQVKVLTKLNN